MNLRNRILGYRFDDWWRDIKSWCIVPCYDNRNFTLNALSRIRNYARSRMGYIWRNSLYAKSRFVFKLKFLFLWIYFWFIINSLFLRFWKEFYFQNEVLSGKKRSFYCLITYIMCFFQRLFQMQGSLLVSLFLFFKIAVSIWNTHFIRFSFCVVNMEYDCPC